MIGSSVGNYKITEKIGEGGMGAVFKGIDEMLEREVAIKMLRPELARQPDVVERFRSEAVTLAKLNHPNIATLYSFMRHGEDYFMVMEYVRGNTLEAIIKNFGAISYERAIPLFCQALEGIDHAHKQGIVHRDIKPANVMILESGSVKVMDFGIARMLGSARLTRQGNVVGTVEYMSPEQIKGEEADARSDIYSLGILLYEMLTGRLPFESKSEYELMRLQVEEAPPPPTLHSANIPAPIEQAIMRTLAKKKEARYESAGELRAVLLRSLVASTSQLGNSTTGNYAAPTTKVLSESGTLSSSGEKDTLLKINTGETVAGSPTPSKETVVDRSSASFPTTAAKGDDPPTQLIGGDAQSVHPAVMPATRAIGGQPEATQVLGGQPDIRTVEATTRVVSFQPPQKPQINPAAQPPSPVSVQQKTAAASATTTSKVNWKMFVGVGVILLLLAGGSAAFFLKKGNAQSPPVVVEPQSENPEQPAADQPTQPPVQSENQVTPPTTDPNGSLEESAAENSNASKQNKPRKGEKTEQTTESTEEAKKAEPEQPTTQPAQQPATQPAEQPKPEPSTTVAKEPEKKEEKKEEKKKGGGVGGFFKKIFGGGDKKKEEKKPPQN